MLIGYILIAGGALIFKALFWVGTYSAAGQSFGGGDMMELLRACGVLFAMFMGMYAAWVNDLVLKAFNVWYLIRECFFYFVIGLAYMCGGVMLLDSLIDLIGLVWANI